MPTPFREWFPEAPLSSCQSVYGARMSDFTGVQWQPISQLAVFEQLIGGMLAETRTFHDTLAEAVGRP